MQRMLTKSAEIDVLELLKLQKSETVSSTVRQANERIWNERIIKKDVMSSEWNAGVKDLEFTKNGKSNLIWYFMLYLS